MAFDDKILHDVKGVTGIRFAGNGESLVCFAETGIGRLAITNKPTVAFSKGVVCIDPASHGQSLCDDAQLVAAFARAFEGYNPFSGDDGKDWAEKHIAQGEPGLATEDYPLDNFIEIGDDEARAYLVGHGIFHPGTPI